ncbi:MAG: UDP-galactose-lipid carrier transferase, partial [Actinobacteria bacterium]|nr:UDP-galactose-lipid carrier transferase [Actinomycetota bacterium]
MVSSRLAALNMGVKLSRTEGLRQLRDVQDQLLHLRLALAGLLENPALGLPVCVLFEGWDASGKGGAIKRLVEPLDPRHVRVATFGPPSEEEKRHHFLWRFWKVLPGWGGMTVLDRSWYGRILVERVDGLTSAAQWER